MKCAWVDVIRAPGRVQRPWVLELSEYLVEKIDLVDETRVSLSMQMAFLMQQMPFVDVGDASYTLGRASTVLGDAPYTLGRASHVVRDAWSRLGGAPHDEKPALHDFKSALKRMVCPRYLEMSPWQLVELRLYERTFAWYEAGFAR